MTLFLVAAVVLFCLIVFGLSKLVGVNPYACGFAAIMCIVIAVYIASFYRKSRGYPKCHNSECQARSYQVVDIRNETGKQVSGAIIKCKKCGAKYLSSASAFKKLDEDDHSGI